MYYYEVSPTKIVRSDAVVFTYSSENKLEIGVIVTISVGKKNLVGIVLGSANKPDYPVKPILSVVYPQALPSEIINTAKWMSQYYDIHLALVWQTILPTGITKKRRNSPNLPLNHSRNRIKKLFTKYQSKAISAIENMSPGTAILHGVTGSGKTLVYIELVKKMLLSGKSAIILVPEIALTSQLVAEFSQHFNDIILTHSQQTESERHQSWTSVLNSDKAMVIIGPRSALFMPVKTLGLVVVDEFHEPSYKQEQAPRYSALRVASVLINHHQAKLILGSATPPVNDYFLAKHVNRPIIEMPAPAQTGTVPPDIKLVDMTKRQNFTKHPFLSDTLISTIEKTLENGQQSLIFHNRRGTASTTLCTNCGWQASCPRCFIPLTLHGDQHKLRCHICNFTDRVPTSCPDCGNADIVHKGIGTKKIEQALLKLFPNKTIARFDGDTLADETLEKLYSELYTGKIDIIIGTQIIAKGLDLPNLRTVGVIQADSGLSLPDYTSPERTFQLLAQVIGRVGRSAHSTSVIVQSYQPDDPAISDGISQNYSDFYDRTIAERQKANFPPYTYLLKAICIYKTEKTAVENSKKIARILRQYAPKHVQILGPTPAFYERVRDTYRWQLVVKSPNRQDLINLAHHIPQAHWQTELDPISLL